MRRGDGLRLGPLPRTWDQPQCPQNLNPGQGTREQATKRTHERSDMKVRHSAPAHRAWTSWGGGAGGAGGVAAARWWSRRWRRLAKRKAEAGRGDEGGVMLVVRGSLQGVLQRKGPTQGPRSTPAHGARRRACCASRRLAVELEGRGRSRVTNSKKVLCVTRGTVRQASKTEGT